MATRAALVSLIVGAILLVAGTAAQAAFVTGGVYDPTSDNDVDQVGTYSTATGGAGAGNVLDLTTFKPLVAAAFSSDTGGVVHFESGGELEADNFSFITNFGTSGTKRLTIGSGTGTFVYPGFDTDGRVPISKPTTGATDEMLSKGSTNDFSFDIVALTGGSLGARVTHFAVTAIDRNGADQGPVPVTATFSDGSTVTASATMTGVGSNDEDSFFGFVAPDGEGITNVYVDFSTSYMNVDDVAFIVAPAAFVVETTYTQPFFSLSPNSPHGNFGWSALVETNNDGVITYVLDVDGLATGVANSNGSTNTPTPINATTETTTTTQLGYGFYAPKADGDVEWYDGSLHFTDEVPDVDVALVSSVSFESKNDNEDAEMRVALKIGSQWYASAVDFGDDGPDNTIWTVNNLAPVAFETAANWHLLTVTEGASGEITLGSSVGSDLSGTVTDFGLYVVSGNDPAEGDHARFDNFIVNATVVPEPAGCVLALLGLIAMVLVRRRRQRV